MRKNYIKAWISQKPVRIDNCKDFLYRLNFAGLENLRLYAEKICDVLNIDMPKIYLLGSMGYFFNEDGFIVLQKHPSIYIYYNEKMMGYILAHELYHAYQFKYHRDRFKGHRTAKEKEEINEIEATAFALAFFEGYLNKNIPNDYLRHSAFTRSTLEDTNEDGEPNAVRNLAEHYKLLYFHNIYELD